MMRGTAPYVRNVWSDEQPGEGLGRYPFVLRLQKVNRSGYCWLSIMSP